MKSTIVLSFSMLTALAAVATYAADPTPGAVPVAGGPTAEEISAVRSATAAPCEPAEAVVPKRHLAFDQSDEEYPVEIYHVSSSAGGMMGGSFAGGMMGGAMTGMVGAPITSLVPKDVPLYVAVLNLRFKFPPPPPGAKVTNERYQFHVASEQSQFQIQFQESQSAVLRLLVNQTPRERLPSKEVLFELTQNADLFVKPTISYAVTRSSGFPDMSLPVVHLQILASTPQRAKEFVEAVLTLYDYGLSYPLYCGIQQQPALYSASLEAARKNLAAAKTKFTGLEKELDPLKGYEDITQQSIGSLVGQQRMIEVDLAGIQARIEACNKLLAEPAAIPVTRREQVETVKVSAEIELVGLAARKKAIERLVTNGRRRIELWARLSIALGEVSRWQGEVKQAEYPIEAAKMARDEKLPFAQVQGKVLVRRVKWVDPTRSMGMPGMGGMSSGMGGMSSGMPGMMPGMGGMGSGMSMPGMMPGAAPPRRTTSSPQPKAPPQQRKTPGASGKSVPSTKEPKSDP